MGRGDYILYKNSERHFEVRHLSFITNYDVAYLMHLCLTVMFVALEANGATIKGKSMATFLKPLLLTVNYNRVAFTCPAGYLIRVYCVGANHCATI